jgi:hypothetical protein
MNYILVPFVSFRLKNGKKLWIDAYFTKKLSEEFRIASLIRSSIEGKEGKESEETEVTDEKSYKLEKLLKPSEFKELVLGTLDKVNSQLKAVKSERGRYYARWNLLRVLFIPFGWSRKIKEDEARSGLQRELTYSEEILKAISSATPLGEVAYFRLKVIDGKPADRVYEKLYKIDQGFKDAFDEIVKMKAEKS